MKTVQFTAIFQPLEVLSRCEDLITLAVASEGHVCCRDGRSQMSGVTCYDLLAKGVSVNLPVVVNLP